MANVAVRATTPEENAALVLKRHRARKWMSKNPLAWAMHLKVRRHFREEQKKVVALND